MKKSRLINLIIFLTSIYIPILIFASLDYFLNSSKRDLDTIFLFTKKAFSERLQKIDLLTKGYLPFYNPNTTKKYVKGNNFYPIGSLPYTKTYLCDEGYGLIKYKTDRFGLRNKDSVWDIVNKKTNVFLIGDSFAHGSCVPEGQNISSLIHENTSFNSINLASPSNGPYEYEAILKSLVSPIVNFKNNDNFVILIFYKNDNIETNKKDDLLLKNNIPIVKFTNDQIKPKKFYEKNNIELINNNLPTTKFDILRSMELQLDYLRF